MGYFDKTFLEVGCLLLPVFALGVGIVLAIERLMRLLF